MEELRDMEEESFGKEPWCSVCYLPIRDGSKHVKCRKWLADTAGVVPAR